MAPLTDREQHLFDWLTNYFQTFHYPPTVRQMAEGLKYTSNAPIQALRKQLRQKGYITWVDRKPGTLQLCHGPERRPWNDRGTPVDGLEQPRGIPLMGTIAAGAVVESFTDAPNEYVEVPNRFNTAEHYVLRVIGDSMIDAGIFRNDQVILRRNPDPWTLKPKGAIVAAYVEGEGTTLKYFEPVGDRIRLIPANPAFQTIERAATRVQIQGLVVHLNRDYE
jgi:repressor LexA